MGPSFIACDREQSFLMPPDVREWLPENHLAWFVLAAVEEMDLWPFYAAHRVDGKSRPAYEPAMMVALLLYAYARGIRSSRVIERACVEDVAFRVVAAQQRPDHATIARFIERHETAMAGLFGEVLLLCARSGLAKVGVIAVDGTKVAATTAAQADPARDRMRNGRRLGTHSPPKPYTPPTVPEGRINTTDPDSHVVKGLRGFIQGYNAQAVTNEHQIVLAAEVMTA